VEAVADPGMETRLVQVVQEAEVVLLLKVADQTDTLDPTIVVTLTWVVAELLEKAFLEAQA